MDFHEEIETSQTEQEENEGECAEFVQVFIKEEVLDDDEYSREVASPSVEEDGETIASLSAFKEEETNMIHSREEFTSENDQVCNVSQSETGLGFAQVFIKEDVPHGKTMTSSPASADAKKHSRNVCSFAGCGRSKASCPNLHFYSFPVKRPYICGLWIKNCANESLDTVDKKALNRRIVCENHFEEDCFQNLMKIRLKPSAVPTISSSEDVCITEGTSSKIGIESDLQQLLTVEPTIEEITVIPTFQEIRTIEETKVIPTFQEIPTIEKTPVVVADSSYELAGVPGTSAAKAQSRRPLFSTAERKIAVKRKGHKQTPKKYLARTMKKRIQLKLLSSRKLKKRHQQRLKRIARKPTTKITNEMIMAAIQTALPKNVSNFLCMQLSHAGKKSQTWTESEITQASAMRYKSPAVYEQMRKDGFSLPSSSTLARWLHAVDLRPGVCPEVMKMLKNKVEHMADWEKNAVLLFDEMSVKSSLDYDCKRDVIEGLLDLGENGRKPYPATHVLLFMARGLTHSWKMPIAYFTTNNSVDSSLVAKLIKKCVKACHSSGLKVRAVVCDQSSVNRKAARILKVSSDKPHFMVGEDKVFFIFDFPRVIKCVRNNLMKKKNGSFVGQISFSKTSTSAIETGHTNGIEIACATAMENGEGGKVGIADWCHLQMLYKIDSRAAKSKATKLTEKHLKPNKSVKLSAQVFSSTTSAAMRTAVETGELPSSALDTAYFLQRINNMFDVMNSQTICHFNPYRCAISSSTNSHMKTSLQSLLADINWVKSLNMVNEKRRPPCIQSIQHSLVATKFLWHDLNTDGAKYLLTARLNLDPIENEFSVARQKCGSLEKNPSVRMFRQKLRHRIKEALIQPPIGADCEYNVDELQTDTEAECVSSPAITSHSHHSDEEADNTITVTDTEDDIDEPNLLMPSLESDSVRYFTVYGIQTCLRQFNCTDCKRELLKPPSTVDTGSCKENSSLIHPQDETVEIVDVLLSVLDAVLRRNIHVPMFKSKVLLKAKRRIFMMNPDWMKCNTECYNHRNFILNKILVAKIKINLQAMTKDLRQPGGKREKAMKLTNKFAHGTRKFSTKPNIRGKQRDENVQF